MSEKYTRYAAEPSSDEIIFTCKFKMQIIFNAKVFRSMVVHMCHSCQVYAKPHRKQNSSHLGYYAFGAFLLLFWKVYVNGC